MGTVLRTRSIDALIAASEEPERRLRKTLGPWSLTALGIGAVIGSGIFTLTGTAAAGKVDKIESVFHATVLDLALNGRHAVSMLGRPGAGPAITVSFVLVAIACLFAGLCYAELASMIPIAGSAYTYAYAILGEVFAWIIGWDLILEYAVSNMSVAVGFSAYLQDLGDNLFGFHLPAAIAYPMFPASGSPGGIFNIPALIITMLVTWVLVRGVREGARANSIMVLVKIAAIAIFCLGSFHAIHTENWNPFAPHGFPGILTGASIVFFTYIGFDSISTAAEECRNPQRDLPFGIIATLVICTVLYGSVALVLTGIAHYQTLNTDSPVADALKALGYNRLRLVVTFGALVGMISSLLVYQYGQARIWFAMSRDGLLPRMFSESPQDLPDAAYQYLDRRLCSRDSSRYLGYRHVCRVIEHWHPVRVHRRFSRRDRAAANTARSSAKLSDTLGSARSHTFDRLLPVADGGPAASDVDTVLRMAGDRPRNLLPLRPPPQRI